MRRLLCLLLAGLAVLPLLAQQDPSVNTGVLPVGKDGRPLNLDFETGNLRDWTATGGAFDNQPIKGDTVAARRGDMKSRHQGEYWIGTYESKGDAAQGTLTSVPFVITHPFASFLVGGGPHATTCVELVFEPSNKVFHRAIGLEEEDLRREVVDLRGHKGEKMYVRVVDRHAGHWGHVNFDDFRFHTARPTFEARPLSMKADVYKHAGLEPKQAAAAMTVPDGFSVSLFAGEPDVKQPIAFCLDDRGRLWVAEAYSYPIRRPDKEAKDRILIFEDTNGDGVFDKRTVFMDDLNLVSGIEVGFGGVWIGAAPYFMFVPMKDDKPTGKPQILLDGWGNQDTHETLNTFMWGPDGWLYGCHGVFTHSRVGKPGAPDDKRVPINAGIWRYHPTKHTFEVFAHGTSNPWGLDFNDWGQAFIEACVIPHNWHIIQGGRYARQGGSHFNPHTYDDIKTIALHRHYVGPTPHGGNEKSDSAGGGHAHCGTMIYLGGTWPAKYRNQMFMGNIHGRRLNVDVLRAKGSGYEADRAPDFLMANDAWARFINLRAGPDGNVYLIDWYDKQACHHNNPKIWDRDTGRIFKISHKNAKPVKGVDLNKLGTEKLIEHQLADNEWYVRHARRVLQERFTHPQSYSGKETARKDLYDGLAKIAFDHADETRRLRGLWALHATGGLTLDRIDKALDDKAAYVRGWAIQLALEDGKASPAQMKRMNELAQNDPSPVVRLYLASALQRLPVESRWDILGNLTAHEADAKDHNLPLMYWYAAEPLAEVDAGWALDLAARAKVPTLLPFMVRRISSMGSMKAVGLLVEALGKTESDPVRLTYLRGIQDGLKGQRDMATPTGWKAVSAKLQSSPSAEVQTRAVALAVLFGDKSAFASMRKILADDKVSLDLRQQALTSLLDARDAEVVPVLHTLTNSKELRDDAIRALASFDDPKTPQILLGLYASLNSAGKRAIVSTLSARPRYARALLEAVGKKQVPSADVSADVVRSMRNLRNADLDKQIGEVWGIVRTTPKDRLAAIKSTRSMLVRPKETADLALGRALYNKTCLKCHGLFGTGGKVGPDITGANRGSLDYLLENVLDPSAVIPKEYAVTVVTLNNGRIITGIVKGETEKTVTVVTADETFTLARKDIDKREPSEVSMMPEDQLKDMSEHEVRSLFAYLQSPVQTAMLATADSAKDLFNGTDLAGWLGDAKLWRVEKGEIVGSTTGLKRNEFLRSEMVATDFKLTLKVKLTPNKENSGIQFRSEAIPGGDIKGPQADVGAGWWGKLYEEHGRGLLWKDSGEKHVKEGEWNEYTIEAVGSRVRTWINGKPCVNLDDEKLSRRGLFAFQLHSGGAMEVRYKEIKLEVIEGKK